MGPKHGIKKRPSAKTRVRKIDKDLLNSQFSQSQTLSQSQTTLKKTKNGQQTPRRRTKATNSLVKLHQTIFSPKKRLDESGDESGEYSSDLENENNGNKSKQEKEEEPNNDLGLDSSSDEIEKQNIATSTSPQPDQKDSGNALKTYTVPLNTKKWQPLPQQVHSELSTLLQLLSPPSLDGMSDVYRRKLEDDVILPLSDKFSTIYLPPVHKYLPKKIHRQKGSGDFNLNMLHQDQKRLAPSYDINSKQLDILVLQFLKEKEMAVAERKYLRQLKEKINRWKQHKEKRLERLRSALGDSLKEISQSIDLRNSGVDGADDLDMIDESSNDLDDEIMEEGTSADDHIDEEERVTVLLSKLRDQMEEAETAEDARNKFEMSLKQLLNQLRN